MKLKYKLLNEKKLFQWSKFYSPWIIHILQNNNILYQYYSQAIHLL